MNIDYVLIIIATYITEDLLKYLKGNQTYKMRFITLTFLNKAENILCFYNNIVRFINKIF